MVQLWKISSSEMEEGPEQHTQWRHHIMLNISG